jgi:deazaflavin-dependent oxidoreductase (nitroreductase family)
MVGAGRRPRGRVWIVATQRARRRRLSARVEHELDARSVGVAAWLLRRTRGRVARLYRRKVLVLTTTGRRSGLPRTVVVQFFPDGEDLVVVAANSGLDRHPAWYLNLMADPSARVEVDGRSLAVRAEQLTPAEAAERWPQVLEAAPDYARFPERTDRSIPLVRLVPVDGALPDQSDAGSSPGDAGSSPGRCGIYRSAEDQRAVLAAYDRLAATWPVERRDLDLATSVGSVHVIDSGPIDGRPVLLLHAASMGAISWAPNVAALVDAGFRPYAVDHPGEANRSVLADPARYPADDDEVAALYAEVADGLGIAGCPVIGASAGGQRALRYALAHPDRVTHLALVGPMGLTPLGPGALLRMVAASLRPTARRVRATAAWALGAAPAVVELYGPWFALVLRSVAPPPRVARPTATPARLLRTVSAPTLVVLGGDDRLVGRPERAMRRARNLPDVTVHVLPSGHLVNVERAEDVDALLLRLLDR